MANEAPTTAAADPSGVPEMQGTISGARSGRSDVTSKKPFTDLAKRLETEKSLLTAASPAVADEAMVLAEALLTHDTPKRRIQAAHALSGQKPSSEIVVALAWAAKNDPSDQVRAAARKVIEEWCRAEAGVEAVREGLLRAVSGGKMMFGRLCLINSLSCITISAMPDQTVDREQRIATTAAQIRAAVTSLPDPEEQREAEVKALVKSVPQEATYREQLKAFTGITHVLRVMMAGQLEPKFRESLQVDGPKVNPSTTLPERKRKFANEVTDELFRLGLGIQWESGPDICYLSSARNERNPLGFYKIVPCGQTNTIKTLAGWAEDQVATRQESIKRATATWASRIRLVDAAPPDQKNHLSPKIK